MPLTLAGNGAVSGLDWGASGGGLVKITTQTITSASSISINNCFTSSYSNYLMVINPLNPASGIEISFRLRASGVDSITGYSYQQLYTTSTTVGGSLISSSTAATLGQAGATAPNSLTINIYGPQLTSPTAYFTQMNYSSGTALYLMNYSGAHTVSTAYDGITIYSGTGVLMTGTIRIYGYIN